MPGDGGTVTISGATVTATGAGATDIGCGAGGAGGPSGAAGANGANGASSLAGTGAGSPGRDGAPGANGPDRAGTCGTVAYGPGAPTGVSAIAGHASAKVSFSAPADSGSSAITSYTVTATDTTEASRGGQQATGAAGPIVVAGLTTGDVYTFTVKATNGVGTGLASAPSSAVTAEDTATTTGLASSANPSASGQSVTFTATVAPAPDGGTVAFAVDGAALSGCTASAVDPSGQATCEVSSLAAGTHSVVATYGGDDYSGGSESAALAQAVESPGLTPSPPPATTPPVATTPFPSDPVIIAGLEAVSRITRTSRALSFTQRIITGARSAGGWTSASTSRRSPPGPRAASRSDRHRQAHRRHAPHDPPDHPPQRPRPRGAQAPPAAPGSSSAPPCACPAAGPSTPRRRSPDAERRWGESPVAPARQSLELAA